VKKSFKENLKELPEKIRKTPPGKFYSLLVGIFFLPGGSILCLIAIYIRLTKSEVG